ncbi:MAG TPA: universal stress protein [Anaerolineae bacterium]
MYKTILVPLDGSERAEIIFDHVEELASHYGATIVLLRVVELPMTLDSSYTGLPHLTADDIRQRMENAKVYLSGLAEKLEDKGIPARTYVEFGPVATVIVETAEREGADLIAMASHGRSGLPGVYYGSVAAAVLQRVDRPLLIVRSLERESI